MKFKIFYVLIAMFVNFYMDAQNKKPQEPQEPYPYYSENVMFKNKIDSLSLAGTLTFPKTGNHFPAVILISGSGPQNRDSELLGHKPFLVIADYLTKNGIAVLRVDDRGVGESEGKHNASGLNGFVNDTQSAFEFLRSHKNINPNKIGLIGHSLGGVIAPMVASKNEHISFVVLLAGTGIRGDKLMLLQKEKIERKMGFSEAAIAPGLENIKGAYDIIRNSQKEKGELETVLFSYFKDKFGAQLAESQIKLIVQQLTIPWLMDFIKFDPKLALSQTNCPVLALNGSLDLQVPSQINLEAIEHILKENRNKDFEVMELENLNHLFQESKTGLPTEYATIEQTISPKVLKIMLYWINKRTE